MTMKRRTDATEYLFEKMFFQAAHIAILEEALLTAQHDLQALATEHGLDIVTELTKIEVAYQSIDKLKKGSMP